MIRELFICNETDLEKLKELSKKLDKSDDEKEIQLKEIVDNRIKKIENNEIILK